MWLRSLVNIIPFFLFFYFSHCCSNGQTIILPVNLVTFCQGYNSGWLSPSLQTLQSAEKSPLVSGAITTQQTMLLGILSSVGGLIGTIMFSSLSHYLGRVNSIRLLAFPTWVSILIK